MSQNNFTAPVADKNTHGTQTRSDNAIGAQMAASSVEQQLRSRGVSADDAAQAAHSVYFYIAAGFGTIAAVAAAALTITGGW